LLTECVAIFLISLKKQTYYKQYQAIGNSLRARVQVGQPAVFLLRLRIDIALTPGAIPNSSATLGYQILQLVTKFSTLDG
jgi:hypothetical protein